MAVIPEGLVKVREHDLLEATVYVCEDVLFAPLRGVRLEAQRDTIEGEKKKRMAASTPNVLKSAAYVVCKALRLTLLSHQPSFRASGPKCRVLCNVIATLGVTSVITARLHDVNFARGRPLAICVVNGEHPDCGPEPVSGREFGDGRHRVWC